MAGTSQVDKAFEGLRRMISSGAIAPGQRLPSEQELCSELDVSRSSLREAQKMLGFAGVLTSRTGAGTFISDLTAETVMSGLSVTIPLIPLEEYLGLFEIRQLLEGHAAAHAAAHFTEDQRAQLLALAEELADRPWEDEGSALDDAFHDLLISGAGNAPISALLKAMRQRGRHYRVFEHDDAIELKRTSDAEHLRIARAILARDPVQAHLEAMAHIRTTRTWLEGLRPVPEP
ncbi:GntR family transcriptional regulator [Brachybacterium sp. J144]|uniref:FadR/GntR family transcriptional regulator n=1 Tax=Brachybacterium sp. J144 TaxID=3116487 RepID=UPI002E75C75B|nr:GntR family transcriptional regulator [Brachybacterium sp. J144]MEE1651407.1 GntR family transcriptional regulator [Brachybacterium sp. J144]